MIERVVVQLPASWDEWQRHLAREVGAPDGAEAFVGQSAVVWLPVALHRDYEAAAQKAGWTYGQLLGYLAIQGVLRLVERRGLDLLTADEPGGTEGGMA